MSNDVGGVKEVLPPDMILLTEPSPSSILLKMEKAIAMAGDYPKMDYYKRIEKLYSWRAVSERTIKAYELATEISPKSLSDIVGRISSKF